MRSRAAASSADSNQVVTRASLDRRCDAWSLVLRGHDVDLDVRGELGYSGASTIKTFLLEQASLAVAEGRLAWMRSSCFL